MSLGTALPLAYLYWPQGLTPDTTSGTDNVTGAITYFRAENGAYTVSYTAASGTPYSDAKVQQDLAPNSANGDWVFPAYDTRTSNAATGMVNWVNPSSIQIFSSGLDMRYGSVTATRPVEPFLPVPNVFALCLAYPTGENYVQPYTYDDITNFSGGKLEDAIP